MNTGEFYDLTGHMPTQEDWEILNTVYAFHPSIPDVAGKQVFADLWKIGGLGLIADMLPIANECARLEAQAATHETRAQECRSKLADLKARYQPKAG